MDSRINAVVTKEHRTSYQYEWDGFCEVCGERMLHKDSVNFYQFDNGYAMGGSLSICVPCLRKILELEVGETIDNSK